LPKSQKQLFLSLYFWQFAQICRVLHLQTPTKSIIDWLQ
jgi:hypothetical protein